MTKQLTQQILHELLEDHNGHLFWKHPKTSRTLEKANSPIGTLCKDGYIRASINKKSYNLARIVWIFHKGDIPENLTVDHIDCDKQNNKLENLRLATRAEQLRNRRMPFPTFIRETAKGWQVTINLKEDKPFKKLYKRRNEILEDKSYFLALEKKIIQISWGAKYHSETGTLASSIATELFANYFNDYKKV
jgi:hypothetical protein